ncbi:MAG: FKBP-type peptidyl-prolyl cis-trans isomerase [Solirubrobacterales bacterium]|nr:FKBP-type peptidyl-prolyl cis-trans isomerase [Solirubrobacterales bacterium]
MDRRIITLISALILLGVIVVIVVVSGGDSDGDVGTISTDLNERPVITSSSEPPPNRVETDDIVVGEGPAAKDGDTVSVQYVGAVYDTGTEFDASWDRGEAFDFTLGDGEVIEGWDEGVVGMKVGGRRKLVIPPDLAYGAQGSPPLIPGDATLTFVVDLEAIK